MDFEEINRHLALPGNLTRLAEKSGVVAREYHNSGCGRFAFTPSQISRAKGAIDELKLTLDEMKFNLDQLPVSGKDGS